MKLTILTPESIFLEKKAKKVRGQASNGEFCLLPRHIDCVFTLEPGLFLYEDEKGAENWLALDRGVLVKTGDIVRVSVLDAVAGEKLGDLKETVLDRFNEQADREKKVMGALAKIEAGFIRRFLEVTRRG
jgi:F-type H+-transporting ATPase subunit epsilon